VIFVTQPLEEYICKFIQEQTSNFTSYLLAALDSKDQCLYYLDSRLGTPLPSMDIRNCEFLTSARLFREEIKLTIDGRNRYKLFYLTDLGKEMAMKAKQGSLTEELPEMPPVAVPASE
jgi:hypothetical protein